MASKRFEIDMALNASDVAKGATDAASALKQLEDAVGDVAAESGDAGGEVSAFARKIVDAARQAGKSDDDIKDALRSYGVNAKEAERAIGKVGDEFKDAGRTGERALDDLEDSLRDVQRQSDKVSDSVDDFDVRGRKAFGGMAEGAKEVTQEVGQNLGEAVSSIRGDLSDLGQVGQDTLGGLAATIAGSGPAGIAGAAALAAGAVGLGMITAEIEAQNERTKQLKEYFSEAWKAAVEGGKDYIDTATVIGEMQSIMFDPDRADEYKRIQEDANKLGLDRNTLLQAAAGDQDALNVVIERGTALYGDAKSAIDELGEVRTRGASKAQADAQREANALSDVNARWQQYGDINAENQQKARDAAQATSDYLLAAVDDAASATEAVDDFGNTLITLPDGRQIVIDAKTGQATTDVNRFKTDTDAVVRQLNGSQINLVVKTALTQAQNEINRFIASVDGKSFKLHGRVQVDSGGWNG